jgi:stearoyl-CoA desaturase (delta-9 desaturase)
MIRRVLSAAGRWLNGFLRGGVPRVALLRHMTFPVKSSANLQGTRPSLDNRQLALVTNGERYHNVQHKFPSDFRNGMR